MRKFFALPAVCMIFFVSTQVYGWGIWGHNHINKGAVMVLPHEMCMFFYNHADYITEESTGPDIRKRYIDKGESPRHFVNLEKYGYHSRNDMPVTLADATARYGKDMMDKNGILPWYISEMMTRLTEAFRNKRKTEILFFAADLGHYVADAHMPLHTTENHDGELTGQKGIHAFWESQLPEIFGKDYNLFVSQAHYIKDIRNTVWDIIDSSNSLAFNLLCIEATMKENTPEDKQYVIGQDGKPAHNKWGAVIHSYEYAHVYHTLLEGMVEKQLRAAIQHVADFWYTAWVNAGKPDLSDLDPGYISDRNVAFYKDDLKAFKKGKVRGCASEREF